MSTFFSRISNFLHSDTQDPFIVIRKSLQKTQLVFPYLVGSHERLSISSRSKTLLKKKTEDPLF